VAQVQARFPDYPSSPHLWQAGVYARSNLTQVKDILRDLCYQRFSHLFRSTKGLVLVAIALISLVTALWGMLSGPMAELGVRDVVVRLLGFHLVDAEREGRIILLYHTIAMAVVAIEVYIIVEVSDTLSMRHD